jgi:hypothetical protein
MAKQKQYFSTSGAAIEARCPQAFIRWCIEHRIVTPIHDSSRRALLTAAEIERIRAYRNRKRGWPDDEEQRA